MLNSKDITILVSCEAMRGFFIGIQKLHRQQMSHWILVSKVSSPFLCTHAIYIYYY